MIDAYRIESLSPQQQGAGSAMAVYGYRLGMLVSGAGALFLAEAFSWTIVYAVMATIVGVAIMLVLLIPEPPPPEKPLLLPGAGRLVGLKPRFWSPSPASCAPNRSGC
ncbi:MFS transporter [Elstera litoralis]|uniref:MFS transporter n=1 Tax=Elstera litoralis TaxID=552518 RepID=UPI000698E0C4|nr:MFS transporter [Elstera litoralis]